MSQPYFSTHFKGGTLDTTTSPAPSIVQNDLSPPTTICHVVRHYLAQDDKLRRMFPGEKIEVLDTRFPFDSRPMPRLQIYAATDTQERRPTKIEVGTVEIFVACRFIAEQANVLPKMKAGVADVMWHVHKVLRANDQLDIVSNGQNVNLCRRSSPGVIEHIYDIDDQRGMLIAVHELSWIYETRVDEDTGLFQTIFSAGGS